MRKIVIGVALLTVCVLLIPWWWRGQANGRAAHGVVADEPKAQDTHKGEVRTRPTTDKPSKGTGDRPDATSDRKATMDEGERPRVREDGERVNRGGDDRLPHADGERPQRREGARTPRSEPPPGGPFLPAPAQPPGPRVEARRFLPPGDPRGQQAPSDHADAAKEFPPPPQNPDHNPAYWRGMSLREIHAPTGHASGWPGAIFPTPDGHRQPIPVGPAGERGGFDDTAGFQTRINPELHRLFQLDFEYERQCQSLAAKIRETSAQEERQQLLQELAELVNKHFDVRQQRRRLMLRMLEEELERTRQAVNDRDAARAILIQRRLRDLTGEQPVLDF